MRTYKLAAEAHRHGGLSRREVLEFAADGHRTAVLVVDDRNAMDVLEALRRAYQNGREDLAQERDGARGEPVPRRCIACGHEAHGDWQCAVCDAYLCEEDARYGPSGDLFCANPVACEARYAAAHPRPKLPG
jgi:rubrerythrin